MTETTIEIADRTCHIIYTGNKAKVAIIKPLCEFERLLLKNECLMISELSPLPFIMIAFEVTEDDLRPDGAEKTFHYLESELLQYAKHLSIDSIILGGYSLGGLFALWSATKLDDIDAVFAGSPSLWMDGWDKYTLSHPTKARYIYMSLGDKEECTKKKPFCIIGDRVRKQHQLHLSQLGEDFCIMEWNKGGHFADIELRKARGFAWCLNKISKQQL